MTDNELAKAIENLKEEELNRWNQEAEDRIIKALECCINNTDEDCNKCVCSGSNVSCVDVLLTNALDLINRLQKENDTLKNVIKNSFLEKAGLDIDPLAEIKSEAYKEFAERLTEFIPNFNGETTMECVERAIQHLAKEMVGGDK